MKLPENRSDRIKILALVGLGAAGVLFAAVQLGVAPLLRLRAEKQARIRELTEAVAAAEVKVRAMTADRQKNVDTIRQILDLSDRYVLRRRLGNLLLSASDIIEGHAVSAGLRLDPVRESGVSEVPQPGVAGVKPGRRGAPPPVKGKEQTFKLYTARVTLECGLFDLARMLRSVETSNPYLCVSGLTVSGRPDKPVKHHVDFELQWPIWADPDLVAELLAQAEGGTADEAKPQRPPAAAAPQSTAPASPAGETVPPPAPPAGRADGGDADAGAAEPAGPGGADDT